MQEFVDKLKQLRTQARVEQTDKPWDRNPDRAVWIATILMCSIQRLVSKSTTTREFLQHPFWTKKTTRLRLTTLLSTCLANCISIGFSKTNTH